MKHESFLFLAALVVVVASFFAASLLKESSFSPLTSITGFSIVNSPLCDMNHTVFKVSSQTNAHASLWNDTIYEYSVCAPDAGAHECTMSNAVIALSSPTNAHVGAIGKTPYKEKVCFDNFACYTNVTCKENEICLASLSNTTNAHLGNCGDYPYKLCCTSFAVDTDFDGIPDIQDTCQGIPNGPLGGTCVAALGNTSVTCLSDSDCSSEEYCSMNNEDEDGDGKGDACDSNSQDPCSPIACGTVPTACLQSLSAYWSATSSQEGHPLSLVVTGSNDCQGYGFMFHVFDAQDPQSKSIKVADPPFATFSSGSAVSTWIAEYHEGGSNTYPFIASSLTQQINGSSLQVASANTLSVIKSASASCGNGLIETSNFEQCDDNNTMKNDGCSDKCLFEGTQSNDQCSDEAGCLYWSELHCSNDQQQYGICLDTDGNGCLELSPMANCPTSQICSDSFQTCIPPACKDAWDCTDFSSCVNGKRTRTCKEISQSQQCSGIKPVEQLDCFIEQPVEFGFFGWWQILSALILLCSYYMVKRTRFKPR